MRKILLDLQDHMEFCWESFFDRMTRAYKPAQVQEHIQLLFNECLITSDSYDMDESGEYLHLRCTNKGQDVADIMSNRMVWYAVEERIRHAGGTVPFDIILEYANQLIRANIGISCS